MDSTAGYGSSDDDAGEHHADTVRTKLSRTAKGWNYETSLVTNRLPGEAGKTWLARHALALAQARQIGEMERDARDHADRQRPAG